MDLFKAKIYSITTAFGLIIGAIVGIILIYIFPQFYPNWYFGIMSFFLFSEIILMGSVVSISQKATPQKMVNVYLLVKVIKVIASLFFVALYALIVKENIKNFVLVFMVFYLLYLMLETFLFSRIERQVKEKNNIV